MSAKKSQSSSIFGNGNIGPPLIKSQSCNSSSRYAPLNVGVDNYRTCTKRTAPLSASAAMNEQQNILDSPLLGPSNIYYVPIPSAENFLNNSPPLIPTKSLNSSILASSSSLQPDKKYFIAKSYFRIFMFISVTFILGACIIGYSALNLNIRDRFSLAFALQEQYFDSSEYVFARVYRILGNDLPPRHKTCQTLSNLRYILENEPDFDVPLSAVADKAFARKAEKWWVINRIVSKDTEDAIIALLIEYNQRYIRIPFEAERYRSLPFRSEADFPESDFFHSPRFHHMSPSVQAKAFDYVYYNKNQYVMNNNGGRNAALQHGRRRALWTFPLDGNCFFSKDAWSSVINDLALNSGNNSYYVIPMIRLVSNEDALRSHSALNATEEPQVIFRKEAAFSFDAEMRYGRRSKLELLWRLFQMHNTTSLQHGPFDMQRLTAIETKLPWENSLKSHESEHHHERWAYSGYVLRLFSGDAEQELPTPEAASRRAKSRTIGVHKLINHLDKEIIQNFTSKKHMPYWWDSSVAKTNANAKQILLSQAEAIVKSRLEILNLSKPHIFTTMGDKSPKFFSERQILTPVESSEPEADDGKTQASLICHSITALVNGTLLVEPQTACFSSTPPDFPTFLQLVRRLPRYLQSQQHTLEHIVAMMQHYHSRLQSKIDQINTLVRAYTVDGTFDYILHATSLVKRWLLTRDTARLDLEHFMSDLPRVFPARLSRETKWDLVLSSSALLNFDMSKITDSLFYLFHESDTLSSTDYWKIKAVFADLLACIQNPSIGLLESQSPYISGIKSDYVALTLSKFTGDFYSWFQIVTVSIQPRIAKVYLQLFKSYLAPFTLSVASEAALHQVEESILYLQQWTDFVLLIDRQYGINSPADYSEARNQLRALHVDLWTMPSTFPQAHNVSLSNIVLEYVYTAIKWSTSIVATNKNSVGQQLPSFLPRLFQLYQTVLCIEKQRGNVFQRPLEKSDVQTQRESFSYRAFMESNHTVNSEPYDARLDAKIKESLQEESILTLSSKQTIQLSTFIQSTTFPSLFSPQQLCHSSKFKSEADELFGYILGNEQFNQTLSEIQSLYY